MKVKQTVFRLTLPSNPRSVGKVEPLLKKINRNMHLDEIQLHKLMVSVSEAVINAIVHGNKSDSKKKVTLICELLPGWLLVMVNDQGKGFNPNHISNPLKKENLLLEGGRGIFLMRTLMDKVEFEVSSSGLQVRLWLDLTKKFLI